MREKWNYTEWRTAKDNWLRKVNRNRLDRLSTHPLADQYQIDPRDIIIATKTGMDDWADGLTIMLVYRPYRSTPPWRNCYIPLPGTRKPIRKLGVGWNELEKRTVTDFKDQLPTTIAAQFSDWIAKVLPSINWDKIVAKNN